MTHRQPARPDRLVPLPRFTADCHVQFSLDAGKTWTPATVYLGATVDGWRGQTPEAWNLACREGVVPAQTEAALWNCFFDLELPAPSCRIRAVDAQTGEPEWSCDADLSALDDTVVLDHRSFSAAAGGALPHPWALQSSGLAATDRPSLFRPLQRQKRPLAENDKHYRWDVTEDAVEPIRIRPGLQGWHRVYVGMEPCSAFSLSVGENAPAYEVPNAYADNSDDDRLLQEFFIAEADLTDSTLCMAPGGTRFWRDVSIRYIKLIPMSASEVDHHRAVRDAAAERGREFAGYLEPCTVAAYWPKFVGLRDHTRNEMGLNVVRGSTDVYVHVIRIGCKAWYHSDMVEWDMGDSNYTSWMRQDDPAQVAVEEAKAAGLKVYLDAGMNATYVGANGHYAAYTSAFAKDHPELLCAGWTMMLDYRLEAVQDFVVNIIDELLSKYDVDGVNLDFARWGRALAYDADSLVEVLRRVHTCRQEQERQKGRKIQISARVPYEEAEGVPEGASPFVAALPQWARNGLVDRFMVELQHEQLFQDKPLAHYRRALDGTATRFWADLYWGSWYYGGGPQKDLALARELVAKGVDGGLFYYMRARPIEWESINWQLRLIDEPELVVDPHCVQEAPLSST
jgi:hypothetical protein